MGKDTLFDALIEHIFPDANSKFCWSWPLRLGSLGKLRTPDSPRPETKQKPILVWLEIQSCTGDTEALLRASKPTAAEIVLDILSLDYSETIMAAAGFQAEKSLAT